MVWRARALTENVRGGLIASLCLNFYVDINQGHCRRSDSRYARRVTKGTRANLDQLFLHLARKPTNRVVVKPFGNVTLLGFLQPLDGELLLLQIAFIFDLCLYGLEFIANRRGENVGSYWLLVIGNRVVRRMSYVGVWNIVVRRTSCVGPRKGVLGPFALLMSG